METLLKFLLNKYRLQIGVLLVVAIVVGGGVLALATGRSPSSEIEKVTEATASSAPSPVLSKMKIDVAGAVTSPGVYEILKDARVEDVLKAAGGFSDGADREWVSKNLNLAAKLSDGDKLYIPKMGEVPTSSTTNEPASAPVLPPAGVVSGAEAPPAGGEPSNCSRVNINKASIATLDECLVGIGPAYAQRIIDYREAHNGFKNVEEIQEVRGIGPKTFEKIRDQITVD